jgi:hypothetical protein
MTTTLDNQKPIAQAVYLEFINDRRGAVAQYLFMPSVENKFIGTPATGVYKQTRAMAFRRTISTAQPRRQWKTSTAFDVYGQWHQDKIDHASLSDDELRGTTMLNILQYLCFSPLSRFVSSGFTLRTPPIVIEITEEDAAAAINGKTPYKALGRVHKVRSSRKLDKNLLAF